MIIIGLFAIKINIQVHYEIKLIILKYIEFKYKIIVNI